MNHFIEYGEDLKGKGHIVIHTGSRNLGARVCEYWMSSGYNSIVRKMIEEETLKIKEREPNKYKWKDLIKQSIKNIKENAKEGYLSNDSAKGDYSDMIISQAYASFNHSEIIRRILKILKEFNIKKVDQIKSTHNYIDFEDMIIRKGAISARKDQICIIPFNMRDGFGIFRGLGNLDWNNSAPHGAGRRLSRMKAFETLDIEDFKESMKDVYSTSVIPEVLDESPMAYKDPNEILDQIEGETVELLNIIRPKINIKDNGTRTRKSRRETKI